MDHIAQLRTVYVALTRRCNLDCPYCYSESGPGPFPEMPTSLLLDLIRCVAGVEPDKVVFTGGEPLLRQDLYELAAAFRVNRGCSTLSLSTNGRLVQKDEAKTIAGLFDEVRVSLNPFTGNEVTVGETEYSGALVAMDRLATCGIPVIAAVTVTSHNARHLPRAVHHLVSSGVTRIKLIAVKPIGRAVLDKSMLLSAEAIHQLSASVSSALGSGPSDEADDAAECGIGSNLFINSDGSVYPCYGFAHPEFCLGQWREGARFNDFIDALHRCVEGIVTMARSAVPPLSGCLGESLYYSRHGL